MNILVVGSLHLDVVLRAPHLPARDETVAGTGVEYVFGGKGGNQALAAARMGADVSLAGRAGSDRFGDMIRETLRASTVDLSQLLQDSGASGMSAAIVDGNGDYGAVIVSAANLNIEADRIVIPDGAGIVLLQNEIPDAVNAKTAARAKAAGAMVWLNAAPARPLSPALAANTDLLVVNRVENDFYGCETTCERLTTLGPDGAVYRGRTSPAFPVEVISTHGAGDMFIGALAARVAAGDTVEAALPFAQAAAALHISTGAGARASLDARAVLEFMARHSRR